MSRRHTALAAMCIATMAGCGDRLAYPPDATDAEKVQILQLHKIRQISPAITRTVDELDGKRLMVRYEPTFTHDGKGWVAAYFMTALDVMKKLNEIAPGNTYEQIVFDVRMHTIDRYGIGRRTQGMLIEYNWQEIRGTNWHQLNWREVGNLLEKVTFQRIGLESGAEYCLDGDNAQWAKTFCNNVQSAVQR
jgi:hypothetical protein